MNEVWIYGFILVDIMAQYVNLLRQIKQEKNILKIPNINFNKSILHEL